MRLFAIPIVLLMMACTAKDTSQDTGELPDEVPGMKRVEPGSFSMGCTEAQESVCEMEEEGPVHKVTLTRAFLMDETEVTQEDFEAHLGVNPSEQADCPDCPVESISNQQAFEYANARSEKQGLELCYSCQEGGCDPIENFLDCEGFRLPTEAEWEYAARCGTDLVYAGSDEAFDVAWTAHSSTGEVHPVGQLQPNGCGIHDLSGNVWELVNDYFNSYPASDQVDPLGPEGGELRVLRGGAWNLEPQHARVSNRWDYLEEVGPNVGFRLVRSDI